MSNDALHVNKVMITGSLTSEPSIGETDNGATSIFFKMTEVRTGNVWHCRAFDRIADFVLDHLDVGVVVMFEGRLEQKSWRDDDNNQRRRISIRVTRVHAPVHIEEHATA